MSVSRAARALSIAIALIFWCCAGFVGPLEEASSGLDRWAAAFNSNDADAVAKLYAPDAILLGTVSPTVTEGSEGIHGYFARAFEGVAARGTRAKVEITERHMMPLGDTAALATGFYNFAMGPARYTIVFIKRGNDWLIAHHHSSRRPEPPK